MRKVLFSVLILFGGFIPGAHAQFEIVPDDKAKVLKGIITKDVLENDPAFTWFIENQKNYIPDATAVETLKQNKDSVEFIIFGGTWCDDTQNLLPHFYTMANLAGFSTDKITIVAVDRKKKTLGHLSEAMGVTHVPTFIAMKNGKEIGRVVEYGKTGQPDKEIIEIVGASK